MIIRGIIFATPGFFRYYNITLLNQVCVGHRLACTWFLIIDPVRIVGMHACICVSPHQRLLIASGVIWRNMDLIQLDKQVLQLLYGNCSRYR